MLEAPPFMLRSVGPAKEKQEGNSGRAALSVSILPRQDPQRELLLSDLCISRKVPTKCGALDNVRSPPAPAAQASHCLYSSHKERDFRVNITKIPSCSLSHLLCERRVCGRALPGAKPAP